MGRYSGGHLVVALVESCIACGVSRAQSGAGSLFACLDCKATVCHGCLCLHRAEHLKAGALPNCPASPRIGITWHEERLVKGGRGAVSICPKCGKEYPKVPKDSESFMMTKEAVAHFDSHGEEAT